MASTNTAVRDVESKRTKQEGMDGVALPTYILITPARNEAAFIERTIESMPIFPLARITSNFCFATALPTLSWGWWEPLFVRKVIAWKEMPFVTGIGMWAGSVNCFAGSALRKSAVICRPPLAALIGSQS
jgi:hypothetical protein